MVVGVSYLYRHLSRGWQLLLRFIYKPETQFLKIEVINEDLILIYGEKDHG